MSSSQSDIYERLIQVSSERRRIMKELMNEYVDNKKVDSTSEKYHSPYEIYQRLIHTATEKRVLLEEYIKISEKVTEVEIMRYHEFLEEKQVADKIYGRNIEDLEFIEKMNQLLKETIELDMKRLDTLRKYINHTIEDTMIIDKLQVETPKKKSFFSWGFKT